MMVSLLVAMTFIFGGAVVGGLGSGLVWVFAALAFMFDLAGRLQGASWTLR